MTTVTSSVSTNLNELFSRVTALETLVRDEYPSLAYRITAPATQEAGEYTSQADVSNALADLAGRVATLESLANQHLSAGLPTRTVETVSVPEPVTETPAPAPVTAPAPVVTSNGTSGVDYGAVAYGLSDLKRKIRGALGGSAEVDREHTGAVEWFVACFSGDASFDADTFRRQAG
jgi:hypothetical protein